MRDSKNAGYTLVEVTISLAVTSILIFSILSFAVNILVTYADTTARSGLLSQAHTAMDIATNDVRLSASADDNNRWIDSNAPGGDYGWQSDSDTLVLATAVEDDNGDIIFADPLEYISEKNNIVYFVQGGSLYKRVIESPVAGNSAVSTCPQAEASESCPADKQLLDNVDSFSVVYLDGNGSEVAPTDARSVELTINLYSEEFSRPISVNYTTGMVFRN